MAKLNGKDGHWYTDKNGKHYFVANGESPQEGWQSTYKRISDGKYQKSTNGGKSWEDMKDADEYNLFEADEEEFDENIDDDFGFDSNMDESKSDSLYDELKIKKSAIETDGDKTDFEVRALEAFEDGKITQKQYEELTGETVRYGFGSGDDIVAGKNKQTGYKVGDEVTLEDGSKAKIIKDYGEGNFEVLADDGGKYHYDSADLNMYKNRTKNS